VTHYPARQIQVRLADQVVSCHVPDNPEAHMQACWDAYGQDEAFFPFWLETWPSAFGLYQFIRERNLCVDGALEIGCGSGVLGQLLSDYPGKIFHSDLVPQACRFARRYIPANRAVIAADFTRSCFRRRFPVILGADLFYEDVLVTGVCSFLKQHLAEDGVAWIADPLRAHRAEKTAAILGTSGLTVQGTHCNVLVNDQMMRFMLWELRITKMRSHR